MNPPFNLFRRHRIDTLPIVVILPFAGCNCRCIMCDYWLGDGAADRLSVDDVARQTDAFRRLGVQWVLISGGEPLMHRELFELCEPLKRLDLRISLLSNGLLLEKNAERVAKTFDEIIVSLDGSESIHDSIRGVPGAYQKLAKGLRALKAIDKNIAVSGRSVVQRANCFDLPAIVDAARALELDRISFLPVDAVSSAFNRQEVSLELVPEAQTMGEFERRLDEMTRTYRNDFASGFIAESPKKLRRIAGFFRAVHQQAAFRAPPCNAPWVSAVIEADGAVKPCFFHPPYGNLKHGNLDEIINAPEAVAFRKNLKIKSNPVCRSCVCPLYLRSKRVKP